MAESSDARDTARRGRGAGHVCSGAAHGGRTHRHIWTVGAGGSFTIHVLVNHKFVGHVVALIIYGFMVFGPALGVRHNLLIFGSDPAPSEPLYLQMHRVRSPE